MSTKGALIAAAVAGLFTTTAPLVVSAKETTIHCQGVNGCKGKGFVDMTEKQCKDKGGTVIPGGKM